MSVLLSIIVYALPTLIALFFLYKMAVDVWTKFNEKIDEKFDEVLKQNNQLKEEIAKLKSKMQ